MKKESTELRRRKYLGTLRRAIKIKDLYVTNIVGSQEIALFLQAVARNNKYFNEGSFFYKKQVNCRPSYCEIKKNGRTVTAIKMTCWTGAYRVKP